MSSRSADAPARLLLGSGSPRRREIPHEPSRPFRRPRRGRRRVRRAPARARLPTWSGSSSRSSRPWPRSFAPASGASEDASRSTKAILVADTSVIDDGTILGKPADSGEAEAMIARLAGRTHEVWTRFALGAPSSDGARPARGDGRDARDVPPAHGRAGPRLRRERRGDGQGRRLRRAGPRCRASSRASRARTRTSSACPRARCSSRSRGSGSLP